MPTIPHYNLDVDDLVGMDYLTFAKKRMIRDIKTDRSVENADKYISETTFKDTGDTSSTINNIKEIYKLWDKSYNLLVEVGNKITKPQDATSPLGLGNTNLIKEDASVSTEILDKTNIINSNLIEMLDKLNLVINNPSTINKIPRADIDKLYSFFKKWILKLIGNSTIRWNGVLSSQVLRFGGKNIATDRYVRNNANDRLIRRAGRGSGFADVEAICNKFEEILDNWYNFRDIWRIFVKVYNAEPA